MSGVSILILTKNEEQNIGACLDSVAGFDDVVVYDSFSGDRTTEIAASKGARVVQRAFDNWAAHQNWGNENIAFKHPWVFYIDADERMTPAVRAEALAIAGDPQRGEVAFFCGRKNYFMGRWIRHCYPPSHLMRFFRPEKVRFERLVNPTPVVDGKAGYLLNYFDHYNFSKGFTEWFDKHNKYSQWEALEGIKVLRGGEQRASLRSSDPALRRKALKQLSFKMPLRPLLKFGYLWVLKMGFLDGLPGLTYCVLQTIYEYQIDIKMKEIVIKEKGGSI
ncbi:MAG TPA: glycosyltransferase family 2 protein [bacterium]|nr:glycosyltransferase family 2 protein [bacterium]